MVNLIFLVFSWVEDFIGCNCVVEYAGLTNFLTLEAFVLLEILSVVVSKMVVRNHGGETHATADDEVAHYRLKARLSALEITAS